jgi:hypothetical protein
MDDRFDAVYVAPDGLGVILEAEGTLYTVTYVDGDAPLVVPSRVGVQAHWEKVWTR